MLAGLRFPLERAFLHRTKLAYINLPRLLTDAKRDRSARVSGYVAIWLPELLLVLYMKNGELVNASCDDGHSRRAIALRDALARVPSEPEWGEICFHAASAEQLALMYATHTAPPLPWPENVDNSDVTRLLPFLMDEEFGGLLELRLDGWVNYLVFEGGRVVRGYFSGPDDQPIGERLARASADKGTTKHATRFACLSELPSQAPPPLVHAYRELMKDLVARLARGGRGSAPAIAEHARTLLVAKHPSLSAFRQDGTPSCDPVCTASELTQAVAAWATDTMWAGFDLEGESPEEILRGVTRGRRHMFQSAGFFDHIPWKLEW